MKSEKSIAPLELHIIRYYISTILSLLRSSKKNLQTYRKEPQSGDSMVDVNTKIVRELQRSETINEIMTLFQMRINKFTLIIIGICLLPIFSHAQITLTGKVTDTEKDEPIPYATVYIDGTSLGTITDESGAFTLNDVQPPAKLVVSHLSYMPQAKEIYTRVDAQVDFSLAKRSQEMSELDVDGQDARLGNLEAFKRLFLGNDYWGEKAVILNDSVLFFKKTFDEVTYQRFGISEKKMMLTQFEIVAREPLLIDVPALGYTVYVDLITACQDTNRWHSLSYNYYIPYDDLKRRKQKKVEANRQKAYYNSIQHFCRALCTGALDENGYGVYRKLYDTLECKIIFKEKDLHRHLVKVSDDQFMLTNLDSSYFRVNYYYNSRGEPDSVRTPFTGVPHAQSVLLINSDSCMISPNGMLPDSKMSFGGTLGNKRVGAMLPKYYELPEKK